MSEVYVEGLFGYQKCRTQPNDIFYTPENLAKYLIEYYKPKGKILDPARGNGAFYKFLPDGSDWCEIEEGKNFFLYQDKVDWIITNPPFSKLSMYMEKSFKISKHVVYLINVAALFTKYRIKLINNSGFGIVEIHFVRQPETFTQCGRIPGGVYFRKGYSGKVKFSYSDDYDLPYKSSKNLNNGKQKILL